MAPSKIAVVGSINEDFIIHEGKEKHSFGGALYNLAALSILMPDSSVQPVAFLGQNIWPKVAGLTGNLRNLEWSAAQKLKRKTNQVRLFYLPSGEKREILKHPVPKFTWQNLKPALRADVLLLNFISGWEVSSQLFQKLRGKYSGIIHVDIHSLLLGIRRNGERYARVPKNWQVFLDADFVQLNQNEWELTAGLPFNHENLIRFCRRWKSRRWKAIIVTLAEKGAVLAYRDADVKTLSCPAPKVKNPEQTGAGDFFAAGFISALLEGVGPRKALKKGVRTASWKCRYEGIENVLRHRTGLKPFLTTPKSRSKLGA